VQSQASIRDFIRVLRLRVARKLAFDQTRGRLFAVRQAGNFVDDNGLASIEYGATVVGAVLIMVSRPQRSWGRKSWINVVTINGQLPGHLPELIAHLKTPVEQCRKGIQKEIS
jgi:carbonic anhydrase